MALSVQALLAQRARAVAAQAPDVDRGLWYSHELIAAATAAARPLSLRQAAPGATPGDCFVRLPQFGLYALRANPKIPAHVALQAFLHGPTVTDCGTWVQALMYDALLQAWGPAQFDARFGGDNALTFNLAASTPLDAHVSQCDSIQLGDAVYVAGVPGYTVKHPNGVAAGWHVICCDTRAPEPLFVGLGLSEPITLTALRMHLADEYNAKRSWPSRVLSVLRPRRYGLRYNRVAARVAPDPESVSGVQYMYRLQLQPRRAPDKAARNVSF